MRSGERGEVGMEGGGVVREEGRGGVGGRKEGKARKGAQEVVDKGEARGGGEAVP